MENQGEQYAEAHGRSVKAIRDIPDFWRLRGYRQACYKVVSARATVAACDDTQLLDARGGPWRTVVYELKHCPKDRGCLGDHYVHTHTAKHRPTARATLLSLLDQSWTEILNANYVLRTN